MNLVNEREASPLGDSSLTLQENDRKSPSSNSADSTEFSPTKREVEPQHFKAEEDILCE